jgi:hypothetical protein
VAEALHSNKPIAWVRFWSGGFASLNAKMPGGFCPASLWTAATFLLGFGVSLSLHDRLLS